MRTLFYFQDTPHQHIEVSANGPEERRIRIEGRTENFLTPEEAVELARGLLGAVERAWSVRRVEEAVARAEAALKERG